ncbi:hypothetical protein [Actinomadura madurae]|uniref:hypothetical protein n=1 Tax=Actinomadura madurae TaxID=1993 RepID=UPI0020D24299|nr:hypothetical protein [Actinomadura madurae]MCP9976745.1 hypothetical protein [Actinomadura madurae]
MWSTTAPPSAQRSSSQSRAGSAQRCCAAMNRLAASGPATSAEHTPSAPQWE